MAHCSRIPSAAGRTAQHRLNASFPQWWDCHLRVEHDYHQDQQARYVILSPRLFLIIDHHSEIDIESYLGNRASAVVTETNAREKKQLT